MCEDMEGYVWVLLVKDYAHSSPCVWGVYTTYDALEEEIEFMESQGNGYKIYDYEQIPLH